MHSWVGYIGPLTFCKYEGNVGYIDGSGGAEWDECNRLWFCWVDLVLSLVILFINGVLSPMMVYKYVSAGWPNFLFLGNRLYISVIDSQVKFSAVGEDISLQKVLQTVF